MFGLKKYLCFDIGGTAIKFAKYDQAGKRLTPIQTEKTRLSETDNFIMETVLNIIRHEQDKLDGIAISTAGVVDSERGEISYAGYTIPAYTGTKIKAQIEEAAQMTCHVENDVNCAALGEFYSGKVASGGSVLCLTIGTGIGGAFLSEGKLFKGAGNRALEIGYMQINGNDYQELASTSALVKKANALFSRTDLTGKQIMAEAQGGNEKMQALLEVWIDNLTAGLVNLIYVLNPEVIILGGGIMEQTDYFKPRIEEALLNQLVSPSFNANVQFATLGNEAGMVGALYHFLTKEGCVS